MFISFKLVFYYFSQLERAQTESDLSNSCENQKSGKISTFKTMDFLAVLPITLAVYREEIYYTIDGQVRVCTPMATTEQHFMRTETICGIAKK